MNTNHNMLYLTQADVAKINLPMKRIIQAVEDVLGLMGKGEVEMPPKPGIHTRPDAFIHAMPAYIPATQSAGMKWVSGYPANPSRGLPYITGLLILNDADTGMPLSVMDCTWITAMRTGAATAVAAKYLARPESATLGILGCGVQGETNLLALSELFKLKKVFAYDTNTDRAKQYARKMSASVGVDVQIVSEPKQAVENLDIVVTAGPIFRKPHATIKQGWLGEGAFAALLDFDCYYSTEALAEADRFCTDNTNQYQYYQKAGYFQHMPPLHADLGQIIDKQRSGRENPRQRILCANLGLALEDIAVAPLIYQRAIEQGIGVKLLL